MMKNFFIVIFLLFFCCGPALANAQKKINAEVFDAVISEVAKNHYDGKFRQKYAQDIKKFRQKAVKSVDNPSLCRVLNAFLRRLPDSHLLVIAPPSDEDAQKVMLENETELIESNGRVFVYGAPPKSKFKKGDEIISISGKNIDSDSRIGKAFQMKQIFSSGLPDQKMTVNVIRRGRKMKIVYITRELKEMPRFFKFGEVPAMIDDYSSRMLDTKTAYIKFSIFTPFALQSLKKDVASKFKNVPKLVIDLRNNSGGLLMIGVNMASFLCSKRVDFGKMTIAEQVLTPKSYPQKNRFKGRIFILVGRNSYSTAEIFAQSMFEAGCAKVLGEKTSGMCLPSVFSAMPYGFRLQSVVGSYHSGKGVIIEGRGITPEHILKLSPSRLAGGSDNLLEYVKKL